MLDSVDLLGHMNVALSTPTSFPRLSTKGNLRKIAVHKASSQECVAHLRLVHASPLPACRLTRCKWGQRTAPYVVGQPRKGPRNEGMSLLRS